MKRYEKDSPEYLEKKAFYEKVLTIYGRKVVLEALQDEALQLHRLHMAESVKESKDIAQMKRLAQERGIELIYHEKKALSRISGNGRQDQGVALDIVMPNFSSIEEILEKERFRIVALDGITNPQNIGMIIRSCAAGDIDAVLIPSKKRASISPLVIKASVGTIFRMPIVISRNLEKSLQLLSQEGASLYVLDSHEGRAYTEERYSERSVFILGNESSGVSDSILRISDKKISIPMRRGVESLNVAVTASLLAFCIDGRL